jgi:hypothetical protein
LATFNGWALMVLLAGFAAICIDSLSSLGRGLLDDQQFREAGNYKFAGLVSSL